jgi:hypothetical protein
LEPVDIAGMRVILQVYMRQESPQGDVNLNNFPVYTKLYSNAKQALQSVVIPPTSSVGQTHESTSGKVQFA